MKLKTVNSDCYGPGLWAWNKGDAQLHAGIIPPFVYGSGHHSEWLLTEVLVSKYRTVIDGSNIVTLVAPQTVTSRLYNGENMFYLIQDRSEKFRGFSGFLDLLKLVMMSLESHLHRDD